jgi:phage terminase large subunit
MLPEASQARKAIWDAVNPHSGKKRIDEAFPLELRKTTRNNEMQIEFLNGSTWQVVGSDNFNSLVGSTPAGIVYSEWALSNPSARAYLRPILAENGGWQVFITTPRGKNHAYNTLEAAKKDPRAFAQVLDAYQTGVFTREQLDIERLSYVAEFGEDMGQAMFDQEYGCSFDAAILGAVLGRWLGRARAQGRVTDDIFDRNGATVDISSDLGFRDTASWWYWQPRLDGFGVVGYQGASGKDADDWIESIQSYLSQNGFRLGTIWLPHDAKAKTFTSKHSAVERFIKAFGAEHIGMVPQTKIEHRTNAARRVIGRCWFDEDKCFDGISGLASWAYEYDQDTRTFSREPKHNWASHPGDAFSYGAQMLEQLAPPPKEEDARWPAIAHGDGIQVAPLEELWKTVPKASGRI